MSQPTLVSPDLILALSADLYEQVVSLHPMDRVRVMQEALHNALMALPDRRRVPVMGGTLRSLVASVNGVSRDNVVLNTTIVHDPDDDMPADGEDEGA